MERWFYDQETEEHVLMSSTPCEASVPGVHDGAWVEVRRVATRLSVMRGNGRDAWRRLSAARVDGLNAMREGENR